MASTFITGPAGKIEIAIDAPHATARNIVFVMFHPNPLEQGSMTNKVVTSTCRAMQDLGITCVRFNFPGVGQSEGQLGTGDIEIKTALAVIDWVREQYANSTLWLGGFSFGGGVAAHIANDCTANQLLTIAPAFKFFDDMPVPTMPWVLIQGDADEIVSFKANQDWLSEHNANCKVIAFQGVGHFFHGQVVRLRDKIKSIYSERLP